MELDNWTERTELLIGKENLNKLKTSHILVVGLGGVGGFAAEMLCRAGVGKFTIIDADNFVDSNRNRQIGALKSTIGKHKTEILRDRLYDINPVVEIKIITEFIEEESIKEILNQKFDFVVDAIDSLSPKISLIYHVLNNKLPLISSMGAGGKMDPFLIKIDDFANSYNDGLARMLRKRLHKFGVYKGFKVVFSPEKSKPESIKIVENERYKKTTLGTISYMPMMFGAHISAYVIQELIKINN